MEFHFTLSTIKSNIILLKHTLIFGEILCVQIGFLIALKLDLKHVAFNSDRFECLLILLKFLVQLFYFIILLND